MGMRVRRQRAGKKRTAMRNRDNKRGNVATLLIENSSALAILIKSRKSLARSIGQTGKAADRSVRPLAMVTRSTLHYFCLSFRLSFYYLKYLKRTLRRRTQSYFIIYEWVKNIYFFLTRHYIKFETMYCLKIFKLYLIYYNFCNNCKSFLFNCDEIFLLSKNMPFPAAIAFLSLFLYLGTLHFYRFAGKCVSQLAVELYELAISERSHFANLDEDIKRNGGSAVSFPRCSSCSRAAGWSILDSASASLLVCIRDSVMQRLPPFG